MKEIWVYAECKKNTIASSYYELISKANTLAMNLSNTIVCAVVLGKSNEKVVNVLKHQVLLKYIQWKINY